jgi:hypothetical protein
MEAAQPLLELEGYKPVIIGSKEIHIFQSGDWKRVRIT